MRRQATVTITLPVSLPLLVAALAIGAIASVSLGVASASGAPSAGRKQAADPTLAAITIPNRPHVATMSTAALPGRQPSLRPGAGGRPPRVLQCDGGMRTCVQLCPLGREESRCLEEPCRLMVAAMPETAVRSCPSPPAPDECGGRSAIRCVRQPAQPSATGCAPAPSAVASRHPACHATPARATPPARGVASGSRSGSGSAHVSRCGSVPTVHSVPPCRTSSVH
jgi:hypothetical protein